MNHTGVTSVGSERHALRKRLSSGAAGNGRLARVDQTGGSDEDRVALDLHAIGGDRERRRPAQHLSCLEREDAFVPGACHGAAGRVHRALGETGARVSERLAMACTVPFTLKSATASPPTYTRRLVPAGRSASVATGV